MKKQVKILITILFLSAVFVLPVSAEGMVIGEEAVLSEDEGGDTANMPISAYEIERPLVQKTNKIMPLAASVEINYSLGDGIIASISEEGILTISGQGAMPEKFPWYEDNNYINIKQIIVEEGITSISRCAFYACYNAETAELPNTLVSIGQAAFCDCTGLTEILLPDSLVSIGEVAFYNCPNLTKVSLPDSLTTIEMGAFADSGLQEIEFGTGLKEIGDYAFQNTKMDSMIIPEGVTTIGNYIFFGAKVKTVTIPSSATSVGSIGYVARDLEKIIVTAGNSNYTAVDGVLFSADKKTLVTYPAQKENDSYEVPTTVTKIAEYAFNWTDKLQFVTIGNSVTEIDRWAFFCSSLKSATIPDSVTFLGSGIFEECLSLETAIIGSGIKRTPVKLFEKCQKLKSVTFKEGLEILGMGCFAYCYEITEVVLPSTVKRIEPYAIEYCPELNKVVIPEGTEYIAGAAFYKCDKVSFTVPTGLAQLDDGSYAKVFNLTISGDYSYQKAYEVLDIVNQERAKVGLSALTMDKDLLEAAMKRAAESCIDFSHARPNGLSCFSISAKASGENIAAGNSTAAATMNQWMNSAGHKANILMSRYQSIGIGCFTQGGVCFWVQLFGNDAADTVSKPADKKVTLAIQTLWNSPLELYCPKSDLNIYEGETSQPRVGIINNGWNSVYAALDPENLNWTVANTKLATVDKTGTVTGLKAGKTNMTVTLKAKPEVSLSAELTVRSNEDKNGDTIYIEEEKGEQFTQNGLSYEITSTNKKTVSYIGNKTSSKTVTIPNTVTIQGKKYKVTAIAAKALKNNKKLTKVKLGSNITVIGAEAFLGCTKLKTVTMNKKLVEIGKSAFKNCKKLSSFTFPTTLTKVGKQGFYGCSNLKTLNVKSKKLKTKNIGAAAFKKTNSKITIKVPASKLTAYRKMFKKKGISKTAKIEK